MKNKVSKSFFAFSALAVISALLIVFTGCHKADSKKITFVLDWTGHQTPTTQDSTLLRKKAILPKKDLT